MGLMPSIYQANPSSFPEGHLCSLGVFPHLGWAFARLLAMIFEGVSFRISIPSAKGCFKMASIFGVWQKPSFVTGNMNTV